MSKQEQEFVSNKSRYFGFIWSNIVKQLQFRKIKNNQELDDKEKVIYNSNDIAIVVKYLPFGLFSDVYAVQDKVFPNRYFIGFVSEETYTNYCVTGTIVYFNDNGTCSQVICLKNQVFNYDFRNNYFSTYLHKQTLIFVQSHRDTKKLIIGLNLLDINDFVIGSITQYTEINYSNRYWDDNKKELENKYERFIILKGLNNTYTLVDLGSTRENSKNSEYGNKYIKINTFSIDLKEDIEPFVNNFSEESESYNDGYPSKCIGCDKRTHVATFEEVDKKFMFFKSISGLGRSYCPDCKIRYSKTDFQWICCKLNTENGLCCGQITLNNPCGLAHSETSDTKVIQESDPDVKYPYKKTLILTSFNL